MPCPSFLNASCSPADQAGGPCHQRRDKGENKDPYQLFFSVKTKLPVTLAAFRFRVVVLEETRSCQKQPVQADDVEGFPEIEHHDEAQEMLQKSKSVPNGPLRRPGYPSALS